PSLAGRRGSRAEPWRLVRDDLGVVVHDLEAQALALTQVELDVGGAGSAAEAATVVLLGGSDDHRLGQARRHVAVAEPQVDLRADGAGRTDDAAQIGSASGRE